MEKYPTKENHFLNMKITEIDFSLYTFSRQEKLTQSFAQTQNKKLTFLFGLELIYSVVPFCGSIILLSQRSLSIVSFLILSF